LFDGAINFLPFYFVPISEIFFRIGELESLFSHIYSCIGRRRKTAIYCISPEYLNGNKEIKSGISTQILLEWRSKEGVSLMEKSSLPSFKQKQLLKSFNQEKTKEKKRNVRNHCGEMAKEMKEERVMEIF
jgi:hypothetical protein